MFNLKQHFAPLVNIFKDTFEALSLTHATRLAAALSYYSIFSLGPLFIIVIALTGFFFGQMAVEGKITTELISIVGSEGAQAIQIMIKSAHHPTRGIIASLVSLITLFVGSTGVIIQLKDAMNTLWGIKAKPGHTVKTFIRSYLTSLATILGFGFLLMASLILSAILSGASHFLENYLSISESVLHLFDFTFSFLMFSLLIAFMLKYLPDIIIPWRHIWPGTITTAILFLIGKSCVAIYLGKESLDSIYGAAAFVVIVMVWVYYLSLAFFFGAEFTRIYALHNGAKPMPAEGMEFDENNKILAIKPHTQHARVKLEQGL